MGMPLSIGRGKPTEESNWLAAEANRILPSCSEKDTRLRLPKRMQLPSIGSIGSTRNCPLATGTQFSTPRAISSALKAEKSFFGIVVEICWLGDYHTVTEHIRNLSVNTFSSSLSYLYSLSLLFSNVKREPL